MRSRQKIWQPDTAAYKRFQFPVHDNKIQPQEAPPAEESVADSQSVPSEVPISIIPTPIPQPDMVSEPSAELIEKVLEQGVQEGYAKGVDEGRRMGFEEGKQLGVKEGGRMAVDEQKQLVSILQKELSEFKSGVDYRKDDLIVWLGKIIEETCRQVVRRELNTSPDQIINVIRETLSIMPEDQQYSIHVNPVNAELLKTLKPDFGAAWQVVADQEITISDCRIVSSQTDAEARMESRLVECLDIIRENLPAAMEEAG